ncbi:aluminium resistance protein [Synechococcus sp. PCC 7335]|uniref:methionine gamma-lyase family protein n=1 Tax=Synechococcus sp. (strain ATCC 29403 / PCC 7335) TaxID=91464 RepID=UPI00017EB07B|nr:aminotransferase class I/II-fold pyridoxal phosphate-dependent enzyme [Synechococcus sp. PCC 7335]EDX84343.1 aluminium resistance protein [Synechococcus sp. PCC 7335]
MNHLDNSQSISSKLLTLQSEPALLQAFYKIDTQVKQNLAKVLAAFRAHRVGTHHFASVSGYGHDDLGRQTLDRVFAQIVGAEAAAVRIQFVSGTHAIACALFGVLRPGDEMLAIAGAPYDTLEEVIGTRGSGQGSLKEFGVCYQELSLTQAGEVDFDKIASSINEKTKLVLIQRSCGYSWRPSLSIPDINKIIHLVKQQNINTVCFVDNCYGEFTDSREPTEVGADLIAGSLIKNPGGTIATTGGYVAGRTDLVEAAVCRLTAPGIGTSSGATLGEARLMYQGLFLAPQMVGEAMKGNYLIAKTFAALGYEVSPPVSAPQREVIQAIKLGTEQKLVSFCRAIQKHSPIESYVSPVPSDMPGYGDRLVMAGGSFIDGSTSELSADGPLREPYVVYCQGGTHWTHVAIAIEAAAAAVGPASNEPASD